MRITIAPGEVAVRYEKRSVPLKNPERIDVDDHSELLWWCRRLRCTEEELRFVVKHYGPVAKEIEAFFERCR